MARKDITYAQIIKACKKWWLEDRTQSPVDILIAETGEPEKVVYSALQRAADRGYIEYGVSVTYAWPTESGNQLLNQSM